MSKKRALETDDLQLALTNPFKGDPFQASRGTSLPFPTRDTAEVLRAVRFLTKPVMREGQIFKRVGVGLTDLVRADERQADLFLGPDERRERPGSDQCQVRTRHSWPRYGRMAYGRGEDG